MQLLPRFFQLALQLRLRLVALRQFSFECAPTGGDRDGLLLGPFPKFGLRGRHFRQMPLRFSALFRLGSQSLCQSLDRLFHGRLRRLEFLAPRCELELFGFVTLWRAKQEDRGFDDQFKRGNGFGNYAIASTEHTLRTVFEVSEQRDKNDRSVFVLRNEAQFFTDLEAVHKRHVDIQQDQVKDAGFHQSKSRNSIRGTDRFVIGPFESDFVRHVAYGVVVHEENPSFAGGRG